MQSRRHFLQNMAVLAGSTGINSGLLSSVQRAAAIEPEPGSSFLDAEHVVILMQENRSFDHTFGSLSGVRGFNDPRAVKLPDGNPAWVQSNKAGEKYVPFRLDIQNTKITWMSCLPHGREDQIAAANGGKHDRWLEVKKSGQSDYAEMPLTLGYYSREDIPFYYALADAFTVCDQNFCSILTSTTPNRLCLWTGTSRVEQNPEAQAIVRNGDCSYGHWRHWTTFPERLEDHGVSWKIYQNELTVPNGLTGESRAWLSNFGCSPLEWFTQYHVRLHATHRAELERRLNAVSAEIEAVSQRLKSAKGNEKTQLQKQLVKLKSQLARNQKNFAEFSKEQFDKLTAREKSLHERAFTTNIHDPSYREMEEMTYQDGDQTRKLEVPKGDVLHQFRQDVENGTLPKVSWIVPSARLSDHPSSAWYGQWYLSEVMNILTDNPDVWKKTVFILTYDENDGYYDHVPPFQAPHPDRPETGRTSSGLNTTLDYLEGDHDRKFTKGSTADDNSLGLGFRVPMIIASPWSRGGAVCSQVFDHTSVLQFLEKLVTHQTQREIRETNITDWRRAICGDLTAAFRSAADTDPGLKDFVKRDPFVKQIHQARFKEPPKDFHALSDSDLEAIRKHPQNSLLPNQEPGTRPACPLPYELTVDGTLNKDRKKFAIHFEAGNKLFGDRSAGAPFIAYADTAEGMTVRHYAVEPGKSVKDVWLLKDFPQGHYSFRVHGPNGFFREFKGGKDDPQVDISILPLQPSKQKSSSQPEQLEIRVKQQGTEKVTLNIVDHAYGNKPQQVTLSPNESQVLKLDIRKSSGWYDFSVTIAGNDQFEKRYAGRIESGAWGITDPAMDSQSTS